MDQNLKRKNEQCESSSSNTDIEKNKKAKQVQENKIKMKLGIAIKPKQQVNTEIKKEEVKKPSIAKVFGDDDDDEEVEEMPLEAKMKMRNIGRNTPTSCGPNSYGKTNLGFCDSRKLMEKKLQEKAEELSKE